MGSAYRTSCVFSRSPYSFYLCRINSHIMIQTSYLTSLVSALRAETAINSISPESLGSVLQRIVDAMGAGLTSEDLTGIGGGSGGASSAEIAAINGSLTNLQQQISKNKNDITSLHSTATRLTNGLMSAADKAKLDNMSSSGSGGGGTPATDGYDHSALEAAITALQTSVATLGSLIGTVTVNKLATWYADCASPVAAMQQAQSEPAIFVVMGSFAGKPKACGILFAFMDDMNSTSQPHAVHQLFITNFTSLTSFGHDASIHLWHRYYAITAHHGTAGTWSDWTELPFGGGSGCTCSPATSSADGLMLASDKSKLDRLAISSISLSGNTLTINGNSFILTPVGSGGSTPSGGGDSGGGSTPSGNTSLVYYGSMGTADGSLTASQARSEAHSATPASLLATLHSTSQTTFSDTWNKAAFFIVFPKGKYSSISANATTALGSTAYSLAAGTIVKSTSSSDEYDIYFVTNKAISSSNTASMSVVLS